MSTSDPIGENLCTRPGGSGCEASTALRDGGSKALVQSGHVLHHPALVDLRAVGEHPAAADALGINVYRTRYFYVFVGGLLAGMAGMAATMVSRFSSRRWSRRVVGASR